MELLRKKYNKTFVIAGRILDEVTGETVPGAILQLFQQQKNKPEISTGFAYSNRHGYFAIETASKGAYVLKICGLGYEPKDEFVTVTGGQKLAISNIRVMPRDNELTSKITGQVTDQNKKIIPLAEVILYQVTEYGGMIPVGYQKSDKNGYYEFNHVPQGTYKVSLNI